jgi:cold shock protein
METGTVKWYDDSKGYGFITRDGGEEIFVHRSGIAGVGAKTPKEGAKVEFEVAQGQKGPQARNVQVVPQWPAASEPRHDRLAASITATSLRCLRAPSTPGQDRRRRPTTRPVTIRGP